MSKEHHSAYDEETTARCERALVTLLGDVGPWGNPHLPVITRLTCMYGAA